jgi:alanyl aminopeptidase
MALTGSGWAASVNPPQWTLPDDVAPISETIELKLDPRLPTFTGVATIEIELKAKRDVVWVNGHDIEVQSASIRVGDETRKATVRTAENEFIGLDIGAPVGPGHATLQIAYTTQLSDTAKSGPYRRRTDGDWYAFTVFTPIDARRAFPCFDEPRFKIIWNTSIQVKGDDKAFANAPEASVDDQPDGAKLVHFAPTQKIASEVVAFAVGPFDVYDGGHAGARETAVRVLTPRGHGAEGKTAAEATRRVLPKLEAYTGIPYPWAKLDHVGLPEGAFGAVENPGLITYIARALLLPADAPEAKVRALDGLEAHEIAHQWFGNLVTQATWEDVWLSEGFATWFSSEVMDEFEPAANEHVKLEARRARIMAADDSAKSHPVHNPKHTRAEMDSVYDQFPYQKGAAILLTMEGWLGKDKLRDGLRAYLQKYSMSNASSSELAFELSKASGVADVEPVLESLLNHKGVPEIEGRFDCDQGKATIVQAAPPGDKVQAIPVCYRAEGGAAACIVSKSAKTEVAVNGCPTWIEWNSGGMGYFRTRYTGLSAVPPLDQLTAPEKLTLALDLRWSIERGALTREDVAEVMKALEQDPNPDVAAAAAGPKSK